MSESRASGASSRAWPIPWHVVRGREPAGPATPPRFDPSPDGVHAYLSDAARMPGGHAEAVAYPTTEAEVATLLRERSHVLAVGAQSSLTGGATPTGGLVLSTARMKALITSSHRVIVGSGVTLTEIESALAPDRRWYPPAPTYLGATVGGVIATNAAGAATFKYGTTRDWVEALTVVLATGDVLDLRRGEVRAHPDGFFEFELRDRRVRVDVPAYRRPAVPKVSCGYYAAPGMDLVDLFIGAEGTLGVVTSATLRVVTPRPSTVLVWVTCPSRATGLRLVDRLRSASQETWCSRQTHGLDVSAIEHMDRRSLDLLREDGVERSLDIALPGDSDLALLIALELDPGLTADMAFSEIGRALDAGAPSTSLTRFCRMLADETLLDRAEIALPGDRRQAAFVACREAVPTAVNQRVARGQHDIDPTIEKIAADVIVPFDRLPILLDAFDAGFRSRHLDGAAWGHISDGNLHANVIPRSTEELRAGKAAILEFGRVALTLGGAPCAEHGVGRNPIKQQLMRELVGPVGMEAMRRVKRALDPRGILAPGVLGL
ncbi:MAG: FAD-binding oxidoreductase [Acidimicrobiia bacterium]|nr:FAD-binding oxidoreductase [Acidimicrobiia bacterium]